MIRLRLAALLACLAVGCSGNTGTTSDADDPARASITGIVTAIDDRVPVDGGVILALKLDSGRADTAFLPSFFTYPPPPPEQSEIYRVIQQLQIGDRVEVEGERTSQGIKIDQLTILDGR